MNMRISCFVASTNTNSETPSGKGKRKSIMRKFSRLITKKESNVSVTPSQCDSGDLPSMSSHVEISSSTAATSNSSVSLARNEKTAGLTSIEVKLEPPEALKLNKDVDTPTSDSETESSEISVDKRDFVIEHNVEVTGSDTQISSDTHENTTSTYAEAELEMTLPSHDIDIEADGTSTTNQDNVNLETERLSLISRTNSALLVFHNSLRSAPSQNQPFSGSIKHVLSELSEVSEEDETENAYVDDENVTSPSITKEFGFGPAHCPTYGHSITTEPDRDSHCHEAANPPSDIIQEDVAVNLPSEITEKDVAANPPSDIIQEDEEANIPSEITEKDVAAYPPCEIIQEDGEANIPSEITEKDVAANPPSDIIQEDGEANIPSEITEKDVAAYPPCDIIQEDVAVNLPSEITEKDLAAYPPCDIIQEDVAVNLPSEITEKDVAANPPCDIIQEDVAVNLPSEITEKAVAANLPSEIIEGNGAVNSPCDIVDEDGEANSSRDFIEEDGEASPSRQDMAYEDVSRNEMDTRSDGLIMRTRSIASHLLTPICSQIEEAAGSNPIIGFEINSTDALTVFEETGNVAHRILDQSAHNNNIVKNVCADADNETSAKTVNHDGKEDTINPSPELTAEDTSPDENKTTILEWGESLLDKYCY